MCGEAVKVEVSEHSIQIQLELPVPTEQVRTLLTEQKHIDQWWGNVRLEPNAHKFTEVWFNSNRKVITSGTITRYDPPNVLALTWADNDWSNDTRVEFRLSEQTKRTRLVLTHSQWQAFSKTERLKLLADHAEGWTQNLETFVKYAVKQAKKP